MKIKTILFFTLLFFSFAVYPQCNVLPLPYTQDFEDTTVPDIPDCTTITNESSGNDWEVVDNPGNDFTSQTLTYTANNETADVWFFTEEITLQAGVYYDLSFAYGNNDESTTEKLEVAFGEGAIVTDLTNLETYAAISTGTMHEETLLVAPSTTGTYRIGFRAFSEANQGSLYIDDITLEERTCTMPENVSLHNLTDTSVEIFWEEPANSETIVFYQYNVTEVQDPGNGGPTINDGTSSATDEDFMPLDPETTYYVYMRSFCAPVWSDWTEVISFTTLCEETPAAPTGNSPQIFQNGETLQDLTVVGENISWFASEHGEDLLEETTALVHGKTYYAVQTESDCRSQDRLEITAEMCETGPPTGEEEQILNEGATIADLNVEGHNIKWYNTEIGGESLDENTTLEDGAVYYASQTTANCGESENRLEVTVTIELSVDNKVFKNLKIYPIPAEDVLVLQHTSIIERFTLYTVTGQKINTQQSQTNLIELPIHNLISGVYFISVESEGRVKTFRFTKK